jgi:hypothetical protein
MDPDTLGISVIFIIVSLLIALALNIWAFRKIYRQRLTEDLPTSKALAVYIGFTELSGTAESEMPIVSYLTGTRCVYSKWSVEEKWSRWETETYKDSDGKTKEREVLKSGYTTLAGNKQAIPFYLKDDSGVIQIVPDEATIHGTDVLHERIDPSNPLYYGKCPVGEITDSDHERLFKETVIPLHTTLYIAGQARERQDMAAAEIAYDKSSPMFLISTKTEEQERKRHGCLLRALLGVSYLFFLIASACTAAFFELNGCFLLFTFLFFMVTGLGWFLTGYNCLVRTRQFMLRAWSQVDIQLKRRNDLIPNLVRIVEGYTQHERDVLQSIAEMRNQLNGTPPGMPGADFYGIAPKLYVIAERYPGLKASDLFLNLQRELTGTEQRIALARDHFNNIATFYNTRLGIFPDKLIGWLCRFKPRQLMSISSFERAPVYVRLVE